MMAKDKVSSTWIKITPLQTWTVESPSTCGPAARQPGREAGMPGGTGGSGGSGESGESGVLVGSAVFGDSA